MYWHALPLNWESMDYDDFLSARRKLISEVTKAGYMALCDGVSDSGAISVEERILSGESESQEFKKSARWSFNTDNKFKSEMIIVKTVAGFLNRNGGSLFIVSQMIAQLWGSRRITRPSRRVIQMGTSYFFRNLLVTRFRVPLMRLVGLFSMN